MTQQARKYLTFCAVLAAVAVAAIFGADYLKNVREDVLYADRLNKIGEAAGEKSGETFTQKLDRYRTFIHDNSQHLIDDEYYTNWESRLRLADAFIDGLEGRRKDKPHMECATRSQLLGDLLKADGIRVRSIDLYHAGNPILSGHAVLDAMNPETGRWETQDTDYDVYWKNVKTGKRAAMVEATVDPDAIQPCNRHGQCGWMLVNAQGADTAALKMLTSYVTIIDRAAHERITFYRPDIDKDAVVGYNGKTGTYCTVIEKNCRDGFVMATPDTLKQALDH